MKQDLDSPRYWNWGRRGRPEPARPAPQPRIRFASARFCLAEHHCSEISQTPSDSPCTWPTLFFVRGGIGIVEAGRRTVHAGPNEVVLLAAGDDYRLRHVGCRNNGCVVTLAVAPRVFETTAPHAADHCSAPRLLPRNPAATLLFHRLVNVTRQPADAPEVDELATGLLEHCLEPLAAPSRLWVVPRQPASSTASLVNRVKQLLAQQASQPLRLATLADEVGCSRYHLCRLFRASTGMTLSQYVHRLRIDEALDRLAAGEVSLTELAGDLGFASHSHFTQVFRRELGQTPSEVRWGLRCRLPASQHSASPAVHRRRSRH